MVERIFGLDGEMSGADSDVHQLIQIGVAVDTDPAGEPLPKPLWFSSLIGWSEEELVWDMRAQAVHGFSYETILEAPPAYEVDAALMEWLLDRGALKDKRRLQVMCGFNVGAFDAPFLRRALPESTAFFSRRYADLNPVSFMLAGSGFGRIAGGKMETAGWKRRMRTSGINYAREAGCTLAEHDAGFDALQALGAWRAVESLMDSAVDDAVAHRREARARRKAAPASKDFHG